MFGKRRIYLDYAAGATGNPSSPHYEGRQAKGKLEDARTAIARLVEVQSDDVIFTSGATESNALAILGHVRALKMAGRKELHMLYLPSAHASIVENANLLMAEGVAIEALPIKNYRVDTEILADMVRDETALVSMDAVCGETGVIWNTRAVADVLKRFRTGTSKKGSAQATRPIPHSFFDVPVLHIDASQAPLTEKMTRAHFGADLLTLDASKVGNIRGIGALIAHRTVPLVPLYGGGGQERGLRPGSEAPELALSFAACLRQAALGRESFITSAKLERKNLIKRIKNIVPNVFIQESRRQVPHILNLSLPGRDTDYLIALLDEAGIAVSTRSACETDSEEGSRAVFVLTGDRDCARATLRISWGPLTRSCDLRRFAKLFSQAVAFIDNNNSG